MRMAGAGLTAVTRVRLTISDRKLREDLLVHPASSCGDWEASDAGGAGSATVFARSPAEGMAMGVPVVRRRRDRLTDLRPGLEAPSLEGQRPQHLPPRLDQV